MTVAYRCSMIYYFPLLGGCYVYCVLINVLNHLHRCEGCYIQLLALVVDKINDQMHADAYI